MTYYAVFPIVLGLFLAMVACLELGFRIARHRAGGDGSAHEGLGSIEAAVFALLGLLLGFAFSNALGRFDERRGLIVQEVNAISTAYLRLDLAPAEDQPALRRLFREYLDGRLKVYSTPQDEAATAQSIKEADALQQRVWKAVIDSSRRDPGQNVARVLVPAINAMIDITTVRTLALYTKIPTAILALLHLVALSTAMIAGYAMAKRGRRSILHVILYAASVAMTIYVVLDLEHPRRGLIRLDVADQLLQQLRESIR